VRDHFNHEPLRHELVQRSSTADQYGQGINIVLLKAPRATSGRLAGHRVRTTEGQSRSMTHQNNQAHYTNDPD
jgi:hypothetical protein